ncbi:MAG: YraN family protein [Clostridia bacterium]|nr:YraN family protein [Clostridia bacterium]
MNAYHVGFLYELRAARYVRRRGCRILARRYRAADGEIDLIAMDGGTLAFIEVKARPEGKLGSGAAAVNADKQRRVRHAAQAYCARFGYSGRPCRFDILEFSRAGIYYMENAF